MRHHDAVGTGLLMMPRRWYYTPVAMGFGGETTGILAPMVTSASKGPTF